LDLIEKEKLTVLFALSPMYRALLELQKQHKRDVSSLRLAVYAMAPMPDSHLRAAIEEFGCGFSLMFGQTEMNPLAIYFRPEHQLSHSGAAGIPVVNVQAGIMDEAGKLLPQGETGEIVYRSPNALSEYLHDPEATREAFRYGWFHSGDVGYVDKDGIFWFTDRFKDVIKSGGENVASIEVEKTLMEVEPKIAEVVVIGVPHQRWSEAITAVIVPRQGEKIDQGVLLTKLRERLSPYKCPKGIIITDALPKTSTGKIQKAALRKNYANLYERERTH
jgi:acyl-CoA synthetase (AMP-forming)/AMP-acid ligase II